ncbi:choice-of-anchor D domain-containing protein [Hanstruepera marina]|uniref:choice-of-anchor D domain-containing protein n=1 Tax=Hanstruepera marina TaxID=2873265 RepID=UPI001CA75C16|nr:choice-of-anchor D domain-containing protein [Hanstruepera marina]
MIKKYYIVLITFLCLTVSGFGQISDEPFRDGLLPTGWSRTSVNLITSAEGYALFTQTYSVLTSPIFDLSSYTNVTLSFDVAKYGSGSDGPITVEVSDDGGTTWTAQIFNSPTPTSSTYVTSGPTTITTLSSNVRIRFIRTNSNSQKRLRDFLLTGTVSAGPTITATPTTISGLDYVETLGPSAEQTFTVEGSNLTNNITLTAPTNFEISTTSGSGFGNSITLTQSGGTVNNTTIYTRLISGLAVNTYSGNITAISTGATTQTVALNGEVTTASGNCGAESFSNSNATGSYGDNNYVGDNGVNWSYTESRDDAGYQITGNGLMLRDTNSSLLSSSVSGGIESFTCKLLKAFTGSGNRQVELFVNGISQGTSIAWDNTSVQTFSVSGINIAGSVTIEIRNITGKQVIVDDIEWTCYNPTPEPEIEIQGNSTEIVDGDTMPDISDDTDFGNVAVTGGSVVHSFTIYNIGGANLTLNGTAPNYVTVSNTTDFSVSAQPTLTTIPDTGTNYTTFEITFDPASTGTKTATVSIANDDTDEDPYTFVIQGNGTNSSTSDIIVNSTFTYNSNIDYTAYQAATITNTGQSIDVFKFDIRDGGGTNDSDNLATELTDIIFDVVNIANIRSAALFNGNAMVANNPVIAGNTISFSGLSYSAPDDSMSSLTLRVTFLTTVTDNDQLQFTISSATANVSGSVFGTSNAGGATSSTLNNRNRIEVIADRLHFLQQPSTTSTSAIMTPAVQVEATDNNGNRDLDWVGNISISSTGTMTGDPITVASSSSVSTFNNIIHTAAGTGLTLTASATGLINAVSSTFDIILFSFNAGDFRPKYATDFSYNGDWEYFDGSAWVNVPDGNAPQNTSVSISRILIDKYVTGGGSASNNYDCDILLLSGGTLELLENDNPPVASEFLSAGNTLEVRDGAHLIIRGDIDFPSSANLFVRSGGYMTIDQNSMNNNHPMWDGIEKFEGGSTLEINEWDWTITPGSRSLVNVYTTIADNDNGYKFGNVILDTNGIVDGWTIVGGPISVNVTENDFIINNASSSYIGGTSNKDPNVSATFGGNLIVNDGDFYFGTSYSNDTFNQDIRIIGDVLINTDDDFYVHKTLNGSPTISSGTAPVIIEGNLEIGSSVNTVNSDVTTKEILFSGDNNHTLEIAPNCTNVPFIIESGDTGVLLNENLKFTGDSSLEIESGATFNFSFNGSTALKVQDISGSGNKFISNTNSTLYITHPGGIWDSSSQGNVQDFAATNTTYNQTANFYYTGKENQVTGDALTVGSTVKNIYVILDNDNLELRLTNRTGISDGGKLEIQQGIVIGEEAGVNDNDFYGPDGQLIMTGGEYRISTITADPLTDHLPQLRKYSSYSLTGGTVHLNGNNETQILSGTPNYVNLKFSGSNVLATLPPLPPNIPNYKGISNGTGVSNNITITEDAIVDIQNWSLGGSGTNLIMEDQSRFIMAGTGTKPDATGTYSLGPDTVIEFNNNGGFESIRLTNPVPAYANIVVSGDNVGTIADGSGPNSFIQFQASGTFTVTGTGVFKQSNANGFSGLVNTSISNINNPSITLLDESTVEYQGANQTITEFSPEYKNVTISGTGTKVLGHTTDILVGEDLNINSSTLIVDSNEAITVDEGVKIAGGNFNIEDSGSLVQINETDTNSGSISMKRNTNVRRLDYVYWSSPVENFNINTIYGSQTPTGYIYEWNTTIANPNGGQGNWVPPSISTMQKGKGYIVRGPNDHMNGSATTETATFNTGKPFNGQFTVNVYRGDNPIGFDPDDDDWNLLGNPYPSAIDAFLFLRNTTNMSSIDGFVNLWTHGNLPNSGYSNPFYDDFGSNYTASDYITYNGLGSSAGIGDVFIAAGQSFMVNINDGPSAASLPVEFKNDMRRKDFDNSQFYRNSNTLNEDKHRIWLDLVSDDQPTSRILVGYAEAATNERDRMYDAITDDQAFYSLIDDKSFVIQGRGLPFNDNDIIPLGIKINTQGSHYIALAEIDGLFETEGQILYLKDNEFGYFHNLIEAPYSFNSEAGTFNNRFEIVFRTDALSVDEVVANSNQLQIIELDSDQVKFSLDSQNLTIKTIEIIDLLGRTIYRFNGSSRSETFSLSNLSSSAYSARVTLSNNQVIVKKAIKK